MKKFLNSQDNEDSKYYIYIYYIYIYIYIYI